MSAVFAIKRLALNSRKQLVWAERWIVFEKLSGKDLTVHRFICKAAAERAIDGTQKSGERIMRAALVEHESAGASKMALRTLIRYFQKHRLAEGFGT